MNCYPGTGTKTWFGLGCSVLSWCIHAWQIDVHGKFVFMCFTYGLNMFESNSYSVCIICYHMLSSHAKLGSIEQKHAKPVKWTYFCCPMLLEAFGIPSSYHTCVDKTQTNRPSIRCQSRWTTSEDDGPKPEKKAAEVGKTAGSDWCNYIIIYNHAVCVI